MPLLEKWTPLRELELMDRRTRRFFEDLGVVPALAPAADVYETDRELVVELEVPGFEEQQLEVEVLDHTLCICGERKDELEKKERSLRLHERLEKTFERRFVLPVEADVEHVSAEYKTGVLTVRMPKTTHESPRKIEIAKT
jgi:HSP20 family protein